MVESPIEWGSVADWVSGLGSFAAVVTALYLSRSANRVRLDILFDLRDAVQMGVPNQSLISIFVTNVGTRATVVKAIGIRVGVFKKRYVFINLRAGPHTDAMPRPIADGEQAHWGITLDRMPPWIDSLINKDFLRRPLDVTTMFLQVHTTNGGTYWKRPERQLREKMLAALAARKP